MSEGPHLGSDPVEVVAYDPDWTRLFEQEGARIEKTVGSWVEEVEHVGSTAVPGLAAKPVIDIMVGVETLDDAPACVAGLTEFGYEHRGEAGVPGRHFFRKFVGGRRAYHLHLTLRGGEFWRNHLLFRDYLRAHPETAREYGRLKLDLAPRFRDDRAGYGDAKSGFILAVERRARAG